MTWPWFRGRLWVIYLTAVTACHGFPTRFPLGGGLHLKWKTTFRALESPLSPMKLPFRTSMWSRIPRSQPLLFYRLCRTSSTPQELGQSQTSSKGRSLLHPYCPLTARSAFLDFSDTGRHMRIICFKTFWHERVGTDCPTWITSALKISTSRVRLQNMTGPLPTPTHTGFHTPLASSRDEITRPSGRKYKHPQILHTLSPAVRDFHSSHIKSYLDIIHSTCKVGCMFTTLCIT